jgi:hypothetical protein
MFLVLQHLYDGAQRVVLHDNVVTEAFTSDFSGLHEGDVISPTLCLFFICCNKLGDNSSMEGHLIKLSTTASFYCSYCCVSS